MGERMRGLTAARMVRGTDSWSTPTDVYDALNAEFGFDLDPCPLGGVGGLEMSWAGRRVYCNPPYSAIGPWLAKAREAEVAVYLVPSRTGTAWWHAYALAADEIRFLRGRLKFGGSATSAPFDSVVLVFNGDPDAE